MDGPAMCARAFEIADQAMAEQLTCHCVQGEVDGVLGLCDENGMEVGTLAQANSAIREAFEWLSLRGRATLERDSGGECIRFGGAVQ
jgi:site-specific recombinase XerC